VFNYTRIAPEDCEFIEVASVDDLPPGERLFVDVDGQTIVVFNIAGQFYAIADLCSHDNGPLGDGDLEGLEIICPRHGARFDIRDGKVLALPAVEDIPAYPVRVNGNALEIGLPVNE
jgi:3-phenylpropionate/trans-cinnamate dioxygenase ferredoxin subunit